MKQPLAHLLILSATVNVAAFVAPKMPIMPATTVASSFKDARPASEHYFLSSQLGAINKKDDIEVKPSFQFQLEWLLPTKNPYMLFVYPILFIFAADFFHLAPNSTP